MNQKELILVKLKFVIFSKHYYHKLLMHEVSIECIYEIQLLRATTQPLSFLSFYILLLPSKQTLSWYFYEY